MQLESLLYILKNNFRRYFIFPLLSLLCFMIISILFININMKRNEDIAYVETIKLPLINSMIMFQQQEVQMLLNSISEFRGWKESYLVSGDNLVLASQPHEGSSRIGRLAVSECENSIDLLQRDKKIGKICYERKKWAFLDHTIITILIGAIFTIALISFFYKNMLSKIRHVFERLTRAISLLESSTYENLKPQFLEEEKILLALEKKVSLLKEINNKEIERLQTTMKIQVAEQVSHDIRSPLAALQKISFGLNVPSTDLKILESSIKRINDIANNLLHPRELEHILNSKENDVENLSELINSIMSEKKVQYVDKLNISLLLKNSLKRKVNIKFNESDLMRVLSNLINNSVDAISDKGEVTLIVDHLGIDGVSITISDTGKGMSENVLAQVGQRGFSYNKHGTGLGLFHAKEIIESNNGKFRIESVLNKGTSVHIELPTISNLKEVIYDYVYIENDELCRLVWKSAAEKKGINLLVLENSLDFNKYIACIDKGKTKIYIDSELGDNHIRGEEFASKLHEEGYKLLFIATGHSSERFKHLSWLNYSTKKCPI